MGIRAAPRPKSGFALGAALVLASAGAAAERTGRFPEALANLSLEELMNVEVSTASRLSEPLFETPAAVHVITRDEIRRAGVRSLAQALRLAPGVEVARTSAHSWAISLRGFNGDLSNKLLVLIDGRSVYSPLFAGVFWDVQDYLLEDIERIEVVGGPGGTLWGANAVNGIINIITRAAGDSPGGYFEIGGGDEERGFAAARIGGRLGTSGRGRAYLKVFEIDGSQRRSGASAVDDWRMLQGGFRSDREVGEDAFTLQGDLYRGEKGSRFSRDFTLGTLPTGAFAADTDLRGGNVLGRWTRRGGSDSELSLQLYYDRTERAIPSTFTEKRDTVDADFQQRLPAGGRHDLLWGAGARLTRDRLDNTIFATFDPARRSDWTFSAFAQDKIDLWRERLFLTLGSKVEHNDYTGVEFQPNVRVLALVSDVQTLWGAVSRAVRIPSRLDADLQLTSPLSIPGIPVPLYVRVHGGDDFDSEELWAYELGWRAEIGTNLGLDLAVFHHEYQDLQTQEPRTPVVVPGPLPYILLPNVLENGKDARARGATLATTWQRSGSWRLQLHYAYLDLAARRHPGKLDPTVRSVEGNSPKHQAALHAFVDLPRGVSLYGGLRYVGELPSQRVPDYVALDANLMWRVSGSLELSIAARNLLDPAHPEFGGGTNELERSWYGRMIWRY